MTKLVRAASAALALPVVVALVTATAQAKGVTLIQQSSGATKSYAGVTMSLAGTTLRLRSADGRGVLVIHTGACTFVKSVKYCLPYAVTLTQSGRSHAIALDYGSVFFNLTGEEQTLPKSSDALAPHTVLVLFKTAHGTYVTAKGTLDEVRP